MNSKAVIACALLLILALSCTAAEDVPAAASASAPAPEVGEHAETLDAEADAVSDIDDDNESEELEQEECVGCACLFAPRVCVREEKVRAKQHTPHAPKRARTLVGSALAPLALAISKLRDDRSVAVRGIDLAE